MMETNTLLPDTGSETVISVQQAQEGELPQAMV